jgi:Mce-associated membrane protein
VVLLGVGGVLGVQAWSGREKEQGRDAAAGAAAKAAALVLSYDYRKLDQDFGAARQTLTPDFQQKFDQTTKVVGEQAKQTRATVKAEVREVSVSSGSADIVNVLMFVNQTTTSTVTQGKPRVDLNRARFTMVRSDGRWLVQEVTGL